MRIAVRKAAIAITVLVTSALMAFTTATSAYAGKALMVAGMTVSSMSDLLMQGILGGRFARDDRVSINWPAEARPYTGANDLTLGQSIAVGLDNLKTGVATALGSGQKVTVVGLSAGALVVDELLRQLATNPAAPDKSKLTFIMVADSSRQQLIDQSKYNSTLDYTYQPAPETKYDVIVVTGEYDGMADFPDRWWNLVAVANAMAGSIFVHVPMMFSNLDTVPARNISTSVNSLGGVTTHYLVPTATLPLVQLFPALAPMAAQLKAQVDSGYTRNDNVQAAQVAPVSAPARIAAETAAESTDVVTGTPASTADQAAPTVQENNSPVSEPAAEDNDAPAADTPTAPAPRKLSRKSAASADTSSDSDGSAPARAPKTHRSTGSTATATDSDASGSDDNTGSSAKPKSDTSSHAGKSRSKHSADAA